MECPSCKSDHLIKNGKTSSKKQRWKCKQCNKTTVEQALGIQISERVLKKIEELPQIKEEIWEAEYLIEQILCNYLGIKTDFNAQDLAIVLSNQIINN